MKVSCIARLFNPCLRCAHSFSILHFQLQNRSQPIILLLGDGLDHNGIAVALLGGDIHLVTDLFAEHRLTERCLAADSAVQRITPHGRYYLNGIRVIIVLNSSSTLSNRPTSSAPALSSITCADFNHALQIADAAAVTVLRLLGGFVFKIFTQVAERTCALDLLDQSRASAPACGGSSSFCIDFNGPCAVRSSCIAFISFHASMLMP